MRTTEQTAQDYIAKWPQITARKFAKMAQRKQAMATLTADLEIARAMRLAAVLKREQKRRAA